MNNHLKCPRCGMLCITNRKKSAKLTGVDGSGDARQKLPAIRLAVRLISNTAKSPRPALTRAGRALGGPEYGIQSLSAAYQANGFFVRKDCVVRESPCGESIPPIPELRGLFTVKRQSIDQLYKEPRPTTRLLEVWSPPTTSRRMTML
jgi:hypothetical protein